MSPYLSDAEIDDMCAGLRQSAAKVRFLKRMGLHVERKPNGAPLVRRSALDSPATNGAPCRDAGPKWGVH